MESSDTHKCFKYFAELSKRLYILSVHFFDESCSPHEDMQNCKFSYKCEDSSLFIKLKREKCPIEYLAINNSNLRLKHSLSRIHQYQKQVILKNKLNSNYSNLVSTVACISMRFNLDRLIMDSSDVMLKPSPSLFNTSIMINCSCGSQITKAITKIVNAPSSHWYESIELWRCHDEDYIHHKHDDEECQSDSESTTCNDVIYIADGNAIIEFTTLILPLSGIEQQITENKIGNKSYLCCKLCDQIIGFKLHKKHYSILLDKCDIFEYNESDKISNKIEYNFYSCLVSTIRLVYDENYTKDLILQSIDSKNAVIIKILSMDSFVSSGSTELDSFGDVHELKCSIKVLFKTYSDCDLIKSSSNSRCITCTDNEIKKISKILEDGSVNLPKELKIFKEEYTCSYLQYY